jgi:hypothetical protein
VHSRFEKRHAEDLAESVSGVAHVQNNLRVQQPVGMPGSTLAGAGSGAGTASGAGLNVGAGATTGTTGTTSGTGSGALGGSRRRTSSPSGT